MAKVSDDRVTAVDYQSVFGSPLGKRVLADLTRKSGLFTAPMPSKPVDPNRIMIQEGKRITLMFIYKMLSMNPYDERQEYAISKKGGKTR